MTIFKKIIQKEIPSDILYEDDLLLVIKDIYPKAKTHLLIIPKKEIASVNEITIEDKDLITHMFIVSQIITKKLNINSWYQLHFNVWKDWWQEIMYLHMHLLSDL